MSTILQIANADRNLSTLMKGLRSTELEETLNGYGPFTILAPINLAFTNMNSPAWDEMLKPANKNKLSDFLSSHVLKEKRMVRDFINGQKLTTINGKEINISVKDGEVRVNGALILARDRQGSNGVVHSVDAVNIPANPLYKV
jgi:uncharacterized surface protein with fasciclin (FAS1) repeats